LHYSLFEYISHIYSHSRYQEILTDPSYAGQFVLMTNPHIGNTGVNFGR
jgi:carbamoylphosphate synthase small subunit